MKHITYNAMSVKIRNYLDDDNTLRLTCTGHLRFFNNVIKIQLFNLYRLDEEYNFHIF